MVPNCKSTAFSPLGSSARNAISNAVAALQPAACSLAVCNLLPAALSAALPAALTAALQCATRCLPLQPCGAQPAACNLATCCLQPCSLAVQRLGLPGRTFTLSTFRAGLWPACYGEGTKSAGRRPAGGPISVLSRSVAGWPKPGPEGRFTARKHYCVTFTARKHYCVGLRRPSLLQTCSPAASSLGRPPGFVILCTLCKISPTQQRTKFVSARRLSSGRGGGRSAANQMAVCQFPRENRELDCWLVYPVELRVQGSVDATKRNAP